MYKNLQSKVIFCENYIFDWTERTKTLLVIAVV